MTISRGRDLASQLNPDPNKVRRVIECLRWESSYVQECISKGSYELEAGEQVVKEISGLIKELEKKI
jgi:hypothetical protein